MSIAVSYKVFVYY